jgi:hypothetical protein
MKYHRSILVSSDNYILDGHHQWIAALHTRSPVKIIRFDAPIDILIGAVHDFNSMPYQKGGKSPRIYTEDWF